MSFLSKTLSLLLTATVLCSSFGYSSGRFSRNYNDFSSSHNNGGDRRAQARNYRDYNNFGNNTININNNSGPLNINGIINPSNINIFRVNSNTNANSNLTDLSQEQENDNLIMERFQSNRTQILNIVQRLLNDFSQITNSNQINSEFCKEIDNTKTVQKTIKEILKYAQQSINNNDLQSIINTLTNNGAKIINLYDGINKHVVNRQHVGKFAMITNNNRQEELMTNYFNKEYNFGRFDLEKGNVQIYGIDTRIQEFGNKLHEYFQRKYNIALFKKDIYNEYDEILLNNLLRPIYTIEAYNKLIELLDGYNRNIFNYSITIENNKDSTKDVKYNIKLQHNVSNNENKNLLIFGITTDNKIVVKSFYNNISLANVHYNNFGAVPNNNLNTDILIKLLMKRIEQLNINDKYQ